MITSIILGALLLFSIWYLTYVRNPANDAMKIELDQLRVKEDALTRQVAKEEQIRSNVLQILQLTQAKVEELEIALNKQKEVSATILSQKKSSETRLGQISENLVPFLEGFPYDPKTAHFLGNPIDYIIFDTNSANPSIIFLEVKTGNSKLSSSQKHIKNLIKNGQVKFEEIRLGEKGTKYKGSTNE